jgi:hypothetical protein
MSGPSGGQVVRESKPDFCWSITGLSALQLNKQNIVARNAVNKQDIVLDNASLNAGNGAFTIGNAIIDDISTLYDDRECIL